MTKYEQWIADYISSGKHIRGECHLVSIEMQKQFPELELRGGYSHTELGCEIHYWLVDPDHNIVDPTKSQYGEMGVIYEDAGTTDPHQLLARFLRHPSIDIYA